MALRPESARRTPHDRLADSLVRLRPVLNEGIYRTGGIPRRDFERIQRAGYLAEIINGWYHVTNPAAPIGASDWQGHFWPFLRQYLTDRFGDRYCLAVQSSLLIHAGLTKVPEQTLVLIDRPHGKRIDLPHGCSLLSYEEKSGLAAQVSVLNGIRVMPLEVALSRAPEGFFRTSPLEAASILATIADPSAIIRVLIETGAPIFGGRVAGAFRHIGRDDFADRIMQSLRGARLEPIESNPFDRAIPIIGSQRVRSPHVARIQMMWAAMREPVIDAFEVTPGIPSDIASYLDRIEQISRLDAYHSLSIEGYKVDAALIERVRAGAFDPDKMEQERQNRDALAARGYYEASLEVRKSIEKILRGAPPSELIRVAHHDWFRAMFAVAVRAGLHEASELAGYRGHQVYINGSNHLPLPSDVVVDAMEALFDLIAKEEHPAVRAVLGHFIFVFIHPYGDGNGRIGRFMMNALFASGGYPWTIVHLDTRSRYMQSLERASTKSVIDEFAATIASEMERTTKAMP